LLVKLQLDQILRFRGPRDQLKAFKNVQMSISSLYDDTLARFEQNGEDKALAMTIFSWLLRAKRPLRMDELREALVVEEGDHHLERDFMVDSDDVLNVCKGLIEFDASSGLVRFAHFTMEEYIKGNLQDFLPPAVHLAKTCLTYLTMDDFDRPCTDEKSLQKRMQY
jgi:hypothetical protein